MGILSKFRRQTYHADILLVFIENLMILSSVVLSQYTSITDSVIARFG